MQRVIIVDSHEPIRETLADLLRAELDLQVVAACATGDEALAAAERVGPDVVLMDPLLPAEDGPDVVRRLLVAHPAARVLLLTAVPHDRVVQAATEAGAHLVLAKSVPYSAILAAIRDG